MIRIVDLGARNPLTSDAGGYGVTLYNANKALPKHGYEVITTCWADRNFVSNTGMGKVIGIKVPKNELLRIIVYSIKAAMLARKLKPDIIIGEGPGNFGASFLASLTKRKGVIHIERSHGTHMQLIMSMPRKTLHMKTLGRLSTEIIERYDFVTADYVFCVSKDAREGLLKYYKIKKDITQVIYCGADTKKYRPLPDKERNTLRRKLKFKEDTVYLLYVGMDPYRKGLDVALMTMNLIKGTDIHLNVIGVDMEDGKKLLSELGAGDTQLDRVTFLGHLGEKEKVDYFMASDLFFFPSRYESIALVTLEALSSGMPVVVSRKVPVFEIVSPKDGAIVVESFEPKDYASEISRLIADRKKLRELGKRGRKAVLKYDWDLVSEKYYEAIKSIVKKEGLDRRVT